MILAASISFSAAWAAPSAWMTLACLSLSAPASRAFTPPRLCMFVQDVLDLGINLVSFRQEFVPTLTLRKQRS